MTAEAGLATFPEMRFWRAPTLVPLGTMPPTVVAPAFPEMRFCKAPILVPLGTTPPTGETLALPTPMGKVDVLMGPPYWLKPLTTCPPMGEGRPEDLVTNWGPCILFEINIYSYPRKIRPNK